MAFPRTTSTRKYIYASPLLVLWVPSVFGSNASITDRLKLSMRQTAERILSSSGHGVLNRTSESEVLAEIRAGNFCVVRRIDAFIAKIQPLPCYALQTCGKRLFLLYLDGKGNTKTRFS